MKNTTKQAKLASLQRKDGEQTIPNGLTLPRGTTKFQRIEVRVTQGPTTHVMDVELSNAVPLTEALNQLDWEAGCYVAFTFKTVKAQALMLDGQLVVTEVVEREDAADAVPLSVDNAYLIITALFAGHY